MGSLDPSIRIPLIDISPFLSSSSPSSRDEVVRTMRSACLDYGFFQLTGHGIPISLQREVLLCAKRLFDLPLEQKEAMAMSKSMGMSNRGYEAVGGQKLDRRPDTKEGFYVGFEIDERDPRAGSFQMGPNFWPAALAEVDFRGPVMEYHRRGLEVHELLLKILALGLPSEDDIFDEFMKDPVANVKLLHYPPKRENDGMSVGAGAHTDFGCTTILLQQPGQQGLQVWYPATESWIDVPAEEDVLIVNVGDVLDKWTGGRYRSPLHRVVNVCTTDRYTVPFFYQGNMATKLDPLDGSGTGESETVEQHVKGMFKKVFA